MRPGQPSGLPAHWTSFVGREHELSEIRRLLDDGVRLVTLTGSGGVGKTRLALRVVDHLVPTFPDGVHVVELAALDDGALLGQLIAAELGVRDRPGQDIRDTLVERLQPRRALLVLDNCEHVLAATASLVVQLLRTCRGVAMLATSREPLGVPGEVTWRVPSLTLPNPEAAQGSDELSASEAVRLFVDRARAVKADFVLHDRNARAIATVVCRLDGIPLAIELAAARVTSLTPAEIAARLDDRFRLLTGGSQHTVARHQTLRAAVEWSHALLSDAERGLFQRLSVFAGGWTMDAAAAVHQSDDVLEVLTRLVDKSLVQVDEQSGASRYRLLETLRQFASERLEDSGEAQDTRRRHAHFFLDLLQRAEPHFRGPDQRGWLTRIDLEHDNLRSALAWSIAHRQATTALLLCGALGFFWTVRGHRREGLRWFDAAFEHADAATLEARAKATGWAGYLASEVSDTQRALELYELSLRLREQLGDTRGHARILEQYGDLERRRGNYERASTLLEQSLTARRALGDRHGEAHTLGRLGRVASSLGDFSRAETLHEQAMRLLEQLGDLHDAAHERSFLAQAVASHGRLQRALDLQQRALDYFRSIGDADGTAGALQQLAWLAVLRQQPDAQAAANCRESLVLFHDLGAPWGVVDSLETAALLLHGGGQQADTVRVLAVADALRQAFDIALPPSRQPAIAAALDGARGELSPEAAEDAWRDGLERRREDVVPHVCSLLDELSLRVRPREMARHNLPPQLNQFVGRDWELAEVARLLGEGRRLLTLTGAGGMGKTRLAVRAAEAVLQAFADGVWLVELASLAEAEHIPRTIATALNLRPREDETLDDALRGARLLLVLDNCEHLLHPIADLVDRLVRNCPKLSVLVTSRQPLGLAGETVWRVPPLPEIDAAQLFVNRAQALVPSFALTDANTPSVASICRNLDGIPLAIELAAARVEALGVRQIADRLGDSLGLLTRGSHTAAQRQQTLRGTLDWSFALLAEPERVLLRRLAVFSGGWTLDAAEAVCGPAGVLDSLAELVSRSLVLAEGQEHEAHYRLLEVVRQYAAEQLRESGEEDEVQAGHLDWYMRLAERSATELSGPSQTAWLAIVEREQGNLRSGIAWGLASGAIEPALRLATARAYFCQIRGHLYRAEARAALEQALARCTDARQPVAAEVRARALDWLGTLAADQFDDVRAVSALEESLAIWRGLDEPVEVAGALTGLGQVARVRGEYDRASALLDEAVALARTAARPLPLARALRYQAGLARDMLDASRAASLNREALDLYRALGEAHLEGHLLDQLGEAQRDLGELDAAGMSHAAAQGLLRAAGCEEGVNSVLYHQARLALARGEASDALALSCESLRTYQRLGVRRDVAGCLDVVAACVVRHDPARAARLCGAADAVRSALGSHLPPADRSVRGAALPLADEGAALSLERAIEEALATRLAEPAAIASPPEHELLSAREREVAGLIAEGLSNREIAERLVIAPRTAEAHVTHVLTKLGLRSRSQVAVWIVNHSRPR